MKDSFDHPPVPPSFGRLKDKLWPGEGKITSLSPDSSGPDSRPFDKLRIRLRANSGASLLGTPRKLDRHTSSILGRRLQSVNRERGIGLTATRTLANLGGMVGVTGGLRRWPPATAHASWSQHTDNGG